MKLLTDLEQLAMSEDQQVSPVVLFKKIFGLWLKIILKWRDTTMDFSDLPLFNIIHKLRNAVKGEAFC